MIICSHCKEKHPRYHKKSGRCKACHSLKNKENRLANLEVYKETNRLWVLNHPEQVAVIKRRHYLKSPESYSAWSKRNPEQRLVVSNDYRKRNPAYYASKAAERRSKKLQATPSWLGEDSNFLFEEIYSLAKLRTDKLGYVWEVDHIIPLQNAKVCGLHVPWNLQVIPRSTNRIKSNKFDLDVVAVIGE